MHWLPRRLNVAMSDDVVLVVVAPQARDKQWRVLPPPPSHFLHCIYDVVNYTYFLSDHVCDAVKEMDSQLPVESQDYLSFTAYEPLLFFGAGADLGRVISWFHPMSSYGYFSSLLLPPCDHLTEWVETKGDIYQTLVVRVPLCSSFGWDSAQVWRMISVGVGEYHWRVSDSNPPPQLGWWRSYGKVPFPHRLP